MKLWRPVLFVLGLSTLFTIAASAELETDKFFG